MPGTLLGCRASRLFAQIPITMRFNFLRTCVLATSVVASACGGDRLENTGAVASAAAADVPLPLDTSYVPSVADTSRSVVDALARFRATIPGRPTALKEGAAHSRDELVSRFVTAVERADTAAFVAMTMHDDEFAWLYYPTSVFAHPPHEQGAALSWFMIQQNSEKGIVRVLRRIAGRPLGVVGYRCDPEPVRQGENLLWEDCVVHRTQPSGDTTEQRLFGTIIERDGRFKFVSYANKL